MASIKGVSATTAATALASATGMDMDEEYDPAATTATRYTASTSLTYKAAYVSNSGQATESANSGTSKLSQMTDEELLAIAGLNEITDQSKEVIDVDEDDIFEIPDEDEGIKTKN